MTLSCNLYVDGEFDGTIKSQNEVNVGKHGHVNGDIVTKRLIIQGYVEGTVNADKVEIRSDGRVSGSIESSELIVESKGIFEGNSIVKDIKPIKEVKKIQIEKSVK